MVPPSDQLQVIVIFECHLIDIFKTVNSIRNLEVSLIKLVWLDYRLRDRHQGRMQKHDRCFR